MKKKGEYEHLPVGSTPCSSAMTCQGGKCRSEEVSEQAGARMRMNQSQQNHPARVGCVQVGAVRVLIFHWPVPHLPELGTDLVTALASLDVDNLAHVCSS